MDHFQNKTFFNDESRVHRGLTTLTLFVLSVGMAIYAVRSGNPKIMIGVVALPFVIGFVSRPDLMLFGVFLAGASGLSVPGMRLELSQLLFLLATASGALLFVSKGYRWTMQPERRFMLFFALVIFLLMAVRGAGLRVLGSSTWGGGPYILILAAVVFNFVYERVTITSSQLKKLLLLMIPVVAGAVIMKRAGVMKGFEEMAVVGQTVESVARIGWPGPLGRLLILFSFVWFQHDRMKRWACWTLGMGLIGLSGFRGQLAGALVVVGLFEFFRSSQKKEFFGKCFFIGTFVYILIFLAAPLLPLGLQRSLSIIPGMEVRLDPEMVWGATRSSLWRQEIWAFCWERVPQYLFIGRGITLNVYDALANMTGADIGGRNQWFMYTMHNYHSGPLYILLDFGIPGLVAFVGVQISMAVVAVRWLLRRTRRTGTLLEAYTFLMSVTWIWRVFSYYAVFGDEATIIRTLFSAGILRVFYKSLEREDAELEEAEALLTGGQMSEIGGQTAEVRGLKTED